MPAEIKEKKKEILKSLIKKKIPLGPSKSDSISHRWHSPKLQTEIKPIKKRFISPKRYYA